MLLDMAMFYRLDGSDYLFVDWEKLDACKSPDDKDARGRRCGQRATSYKGATKGLDKMKKGPKYSGADIKATQKALERRKRQKGQDFTNTREARQIGKLASQEGSTSERRFYSRPKGTGGIPKGTMVSQTGLKLREMEDVYRQARRAEKEYSGKGTRKKEDLVATVKYPSKGRKPRRK